MTNPKKQIIFVLNSNELDGPSRVIYELSVALKDRFRVTVYVPIPYTSYFYWNIAITWGGLHRGSKNSAIAFLLNNRDTMQKMQAKAADKAASHSWEAAALGFISVLNA